MNNKYINTIDLITLFRVIWREKFIIVITISVFITIGFLTAFGSQEEYLSNVKLMPENEQGNQLSSLGSLARQFGVSTSTNTSGGIPTSLYPDVAQNLIMLEQLMKYEISINNNEDDVTLYEYFTTRQTSSRIAVIKENTLGLPSKIIRWLRSLISTSRSTTTEFNNPVNSDTSNSRIKSFKKSEWTMIEDLQKRINVVQDYDTGIIHINVKMPNPILAAEVADYVVEFLIRYITNYRTEKTRNDVEFIEERLDEAKIKFQEAQKELASYTDRQRGTTRATDDIERQKLESEYNLAFNIYNTMSERLEETKIRLQEVTPVVSVLDPPAIPYKKSEPKRLRILITYFGIGIIISAVIVQIKIHLTSDI